MGGLADLFDTRKLCGNFNGVCNQVIRGNETTRHVAREAQAADRTVRDTEHTVNRAQGALDSGDAGRVLRESGNIVNKIGGLFN